MPLLRRRALPADVAQAYAKFRDCAQHIDLAQRAMLRCVPGSARSIALPLPVGAETLRLSLAEAEQLLDAWRHPAVEAQWLACRDAIAETLRLVEPTVATAAATVELEDALTAVGDLLAPLEAFVDAEQTFRALRR